MFTKSQIGIGLAIVLVVGLFAITQIWPSANPRKLNLPSQDQSGLQTNSLESLRPVSASEHLRGRADARVVIIEYSDLECPFCKNFHQSMQEIYNVYGQTGQVAWVFRHFPIDGLHQKARAEAQAIECAEEIGGNEGFWLLLDKIYAITPSNDGLDLASLPDLAESVGLDRTKFTACINSDRHTDEIEADRQNAIDNGGQGTPFPIILDQKTGDTVVLPGAVPASKIDEIIKSILG